MPSKLLKISDNYNDESDPQLIQSQPHQQSDHLQSQANPQVKYYDEYKKIYQTAFKLRLEYRKKIKAQTLVNERIANIETHLNNFNRRKRQQQFDEEFEQIGQDTKLKGLKRNRRTAQQIQRKYECPHLYCDRCYGSDGSLQQHLKIKHPQLYRKQESSQILD